uniref:SCAN box domain-containing protein n=1 Tax=Naja naja TaxID=35670 RepID=A0A8C6VAU1_NAJNA
MTGGGDKRGPNVTLIGTAGSCIQKSLLKGETTNWIIPNPSFEGFSYQDSMQPRELCSQLYQLHREWLRPEKNTKQFLAILPLEMKSWIKECRAETSSQAVALAEGFLLTLFQYLRGCHREEGVKLFSKAPEGQTRNNGWKPNKERFNLKIRRNFQTVRTINQWNRSCPQKLWERHHLRLSRRDWTAICQKWCRVSRLGGGVGLDDLQDPFQL